MSVRLFCSVRSTEERDADNVSESGDILILGWWRGFSERDEGQRREAGVACSRAFGLHPKRDAE